MEGDSRSYSITRNEMFISWFLLQASISFLQFPSLHRAEGMLIVRGPDPRISLGLLPHLTFRKPFLHAASSGQQL